MKKIVIASFLLGMALCAFPEQGSAMLLGDYDFTASGGTLGFTTANAIDFQMGFGGSFTGEISIPELYIFDDFYASVADVGQTFTFPNTGLDPDYQAIVDRITNGTNEYLFFRGFVGFLDISTNVFTPFGGPASALLEAELFFNDPTGINGIDFVGNVIDSFQIRINSLTLTPSAGNPNFTNENFDVTFIVNGHSSATTVPEPGTLILLMSGLLVPLFFKKKN